MDLQLQSPFFFKLPREVRDMIYLDCWEVFGSRQHVFEHEGSTSYFPCLLEPGEQDSRNEDFEKLWRSQQAHQPKSMVHDAEWARRMSSAWQDHWRCEEAMLSCRAQGAKMNGPVTYSFLTCKRLFDEALPSLCSRLTLVLTSLSLAHKVFVFNPYIVHIRSIELSLCVPYPSLHNHIYPKTPNSSFIARQNKWHELCIALSDLCRTGALQDMTLRLDLVEEDRFWWEVRETWALSAIEEPLRRRTKLYLPELTVDAERMRPFHYATPGGQQTESRLHPGQEDRLFVYPLPSYMTSYAGKEEPKRREADFKELVRYSRRRWMREGDENAIQARLEFFNPQVHGTETVGDKMRLGGLFRGMLMS
ncbi:hypothetical protein TruAng_002844 [Truncatella angustata]|nr:hypothetical protein TruAng_002844 [Truncatella angustata]